MSGGSVDSLAGQSEEDRAFEALSSGRRGAAQTRATRRRIQE